MTNYNLTSLDVELEGKDPNSLRSSLPSYKLPFRLHILFSFFANNGLQSEFSDLIIPKQCSYSFFQVLIQPSYVNTWRCTVKEDIQSLFFFFKKEMYNLTSTISPFYFLFLFQNFTLPHFEWYIRIPQIEPICWYDF